MSFPKSSSMSVGPSMQRPIAEAAEPAAVNACAAGDERDAAPVRAPDPRGRRVRFGDAIPDAPARAATGAIAISFAVVSRKHWPR
ncbi:hypothetical protein WJ32_27080 [Burkholderia ubonensis]|uniref:Uncharacterized protein n=1 Tax=Burkholderia ubonensis TaxID=101571 RepID=A0A103RGC4_9BURK|nr:hypothetical protein [Burkholderia ubonensis]AOJ66068.1 hypothetical protein WJ32_27080 [Burkholderia ubonensis]KVG67212.1 hypothetical protein WJ33_25845 [Burkholderia ubonensis]